ncbi:hypothetical protein MSI_14200 [Treponema sp. JC4]|uniref:metallophosphoesterase n=1 Tax=Treponema sp. JC4 TaxID=1124982 RepID=UPI00025AFD55|nr:metallophosphoesterase [Treponema sp. JC4]EID85037.1 hypothetical protein MSI_14200 [Treponema sp. JC4]
MIYITGDTHNTIDMSNASSKNIKLCCKKQNKDYHDITTLIVLGDFGLPWYDCPVDENGIHPTDPTEKYLLKWYKNKSFTILSVMGNHDNYNMIEKLPEVEMFGNKVLKVCDNVFYLNRGEVYTIEDKKFLVLGGAKSDDKAYRVPYESWWPQEEWTEVEKTECEKRIQDSGCQFDYVLSHTGTSKAIACFNSSFSTSDDSTVVFNDYIYSMISYKKWFFGHWHSDWGFENYENSKFIPLYHRGIVV